MFVYQLVKWANPFDKETDKVGNRLSITTSAETTEKISCCHQDISQFDVEVDEKITDRFNSACSFLQNYTGQISHDDLLYFYSRYKQATVGSADARCRPWFFDWKNRAMFDRWNELGNMSKAQAMREYTEKMLTLELGWDPSKKTSTGFGHRPSTLVNAPEDNSSDLEPGILNWFVAIEEKNFDKMTEMIQSHPSIIDAKNENQMTALHWASDRGLVQVANYLLAAGSSVNVQDYDGQTPLHYAVSCNHRDMVTLLLKNKADPAIADYEGNCSVDVCKDDAIKKQLLDAIPLIFEES